MEMILIPAVQLKNRKPEKKIKRNSSSSSQKTVNHAKLIISQILSNKWSTWWFILIIFRLRRRLTSSALLFPPWLRCLLPYSFSYYTDLPSSLAFFFLHSRYIWANADGVKSFWSSYFIQIYFSVYLGSLLPSFLFRLLSLLVSMLRFSTIGYSYLLNLHINLTTWKNIVPIHCISYCIHNLHPFRMVNITASSFLIPEYPYRLIKRPSHKLSPCWWIFNVGNSSNMIFVNIFGSIHFPNIKGIQVRIFTANCDVDGLDRIKR